MTVNLAVRRALYSPGWIVVDNEEKPTKLYGYFSDEDTAKEYAPKLAKAEEAIERAKELLEAVPEGKEKKHLVKRKA